MFSLTRPYLVYFPCFRFFRLSFRLCRRTSVSSVATTSAPMSRPASNEGDTAVARIHLFSQAAHCFVSASSPSFYRMRCANCLWVSFRKCKFGCTPSIHYTKGRLFSLHCTIHCGARERERDRLDESDMRVQRAVIMRRAESK